MSLTSFEGRNIEATPVGIVVQAGTGTVVVQIKNESGDWVTVKTYITDAAETFQAALFTFKVTATGDAVFSISNARPA